MEDNLDFLKDLGLDKKTVKTGFITTLAIDVLRGIVNGALKNTDPKQLVYAIKNDISLWGTASGSIKKTRCLIPPQFLGNAKDIRKIVDAEYGGFTNLVLLWLQEDQPRYAQIIMNYPEGKGIKWLGKQVDEILTGCGI